MLLSHHLASLSGPISPFNPHLAPSGGNNDDGLGDLNLHSNQPFKSGRTYKKRFDLDGHILDLDNAIISQKASLELLSGLDSQKSNHLFELECLYKQRFDRDGQPRDFGSAVTSQEAGLKLLPDKDPNRQQRISELASLKRHPAWGNHLEEAITKLKTSLELLPDSDYKRPDHLLELAHLYEQRFDWGDQILDLDNAITSQKAGLELLSNLNPQKPIRSFDLARLYNLRADRGGRSHDIRKAVASQNAGLELLPNGDPYKPRELCELMGMHVRLEEAAKKRLLEDLQQLSKCIISPNWDVDVADIMVEMTTLLNDEAAEVLCRDIRRHSCRLGSYCEALRSQEAGSTDRGDLQALYDEISYAERDLIALHVNRNTKYERTYKLWRAKREQISNMLSQLDSVDSQSYTEGVEAKIKQVDEGFETIRRVLNDQKRTLEVYFNTVREFVTSSKSKGDDLSGTGPPDHPDLVISPSGFSPDSPPDSSKLFEAIEAVKGTLSEVDAIVGKARYTKARSVVGGKPLNTSSQLDGLYCDWQEYETRVQGRSLSQLTRQAKWWDRWHDPYHQLLSLIRNMENKLTEIQRGFDKYKQSILELIVRPLSDMIDVLGPYSSQGNLEVVSKRFHPDMALYEAAFRFLIENVSRQYSLAEKIKVPLPPTCH
ncbi:hypothetical protein FRC15_002395 [Serendipita sp. 397]|nr:hypothetical protein FRC15_002395 [Serendipita sp. 397]